MSFWIRNMFNVMGSRTYCICGTPMDCLGDHTRVCSRAAVKSNASNHATLSRSLQQYLHHGRSNGSYIITPGEPHIEDYLITWFDVHAAMSTVTHHCLAPNDELI